MGRIAEVVAGMRGRSLREIVETIAQMEDEELPVGEADFQCFWLAYPYKAGKPSALRAYKAARKAKYRHQEIMYGLEVYVKTKPKDRPWLMPATFLNDRRFCDIEAMTKTSTPKSVASLFGEMGNYFDGQSGEGSSQSSIEPPLRLAGAQRQG